MKPHPVLVALTIAAALTTALLWWSGRDVVVSAPAGGPPVRSGAAPWTLGDHGPWVLRYRSEVDLDGGQRIVLDLEGRLHVRVFSLESGRVRAGVRLDAAGLRVDDELDEGRSALLGRPFQVVWSPDGHVVETGFPEGLPGETRSQLDEVVRAFQFVVPEGAPGRWTTTEENATGRYRAVYRRRDDGSLSKRKTAYLETRMTGGGAGAAPLARIRNSAASAGLSPSTPWLERATVTDDLVLEEAGRSLAAVRLVATLERRHAGRRDRWLARAQGVEDLLAPLPGDAAGRLAGPEPEPTPATVADRDRCRQHVAAFAASGGRDHALIHALAALLRRHPDLAPLVAAGVRGHAGDDLVAGGLLHALELGGHPRCQAALGGLCTDADLTVGRRRQAIAALGGVASPTAAAQEQLLGLAATSFETPLARAAELALGDLGARLRGQDPGRYRGLAARLVQALQAAGDVDAAANALRALENTRDPALGDAVGPLLSAPEPAVRATAAEVLGTLAPADAAGTLAGRLPAEGHSRVRASLARALRDLPADPSACRTVTELVGREVDVEARRQMACYLVDHLGRVPEARGVLEGLLERETDPRTLSYVAGRLHR